MDGSECTEVMKGFVLPPLKTSTNGAPLWCSQIALPPAFLPATKATEDSIAAESARVLPGLEKGRRRQELRRMEGKVAALEIAIELDRLQRLEGEIRKAICGREHEKRYRMLWKCQGEKATVERKTGAIEAKVTLLQKARYMRGVRDFQAQANLLHLEATTREHICAEEAGARRHMASLLELALLEDQHTQLVHDVGAAEHAFKDSQSVRDWECRLAQGSFHPTEAFAPEIQLIQEFNTGTGGYRGRTDLLMDYAVCEEEWGIRLSILSEEHAVRLPLEWEHSAEMLILAEEPLARERLANLFVYGCCQAHLGAAVRIQRWWRMLKPTPWKTRSRLELRRCVARRRDQMTARDYRTLLERLRRQLTVSVASPEELQKSMSALERAVELSYQCVFDYFLYTLMNRAANLQDTEAYRLRSYPLAKDDGIVAIAPPTSLLLVPNRLYVRQQPFQPYQLWRVHRWIEGSAEYMRQVQLHEEAERQMREVLLQCELHEVDTLCVYQAALKGGAWTWRSLHTVILFIEQEENTSRTLIQGEEQDGRFILEVEMTKFWEKCRSLAEDRCNLLKEEENQRLAIADAESLEFTRAAEYEWHWKNLVLLYRRMSGSCGSNRRYTSLDSAARVIASFFRVIVFRSRLATVKLSTREEAQLRRRGAYMAELLAAQIREDAEKEETAAGVIQYDIDAADEEPSGDAAAGAFSAWFDQVARQPMEREYKAIVARFQRSHEELFRSIHFLFAVVRSGRERIESRETQEREALRRTPTFFAISAHELSVHEAVQRQALVAEVEKTIDSHWREPFEFLITVSNCCTAAVTHPPPSNMTQSHWSSVPLPSMSCTERLFCREEVVRTRILVAERQCFSGFLLSLHSITFDKILRQEEERVRAAVCKEVDDCWPTHPPVAQCTQLVTMEAAARRDVEDLVVDNYSLLLERSCCMYAERAFKQFVRGHMSFFSESCFFDRRLTELLLQRVSFLGSKVGELEAAEVCARARFEYMEETHRRWGSAGGGMDQFDGAIGIDLGTTYSCVAVFRNDAVEVIPNEQGNRTTPSCVAFYNDDVLVGDAAKHLAARGVKGVVYDAKRMIGRKFSDTCICDDAKRWPFIIEAGEQNGVRICVEHKGEVLRLQPEQISAQVLSYLKSCAERFIGKHVTRAVITVPAYFNDAQRDHTKAAARIAGLEVLRIVNEPTAAALCYGLGVGSGAGARGTDRPVNVLVFDFGGGTFDVSVITIDNGSFAVRATAGDTHLGGQDVDAALLQHVLADLNGRHGIVVAELPSKTVAKILARCEQAKRVLSYAATEEIVLDGVLPGGEEYTLNVSRAKLEELCGSVFSRCMSVVQKAMTDAAMTVTDIEDVILVGGSSRIPALHAQLQEMFKGKRLCSSVHPDEAVAIGAAVQASIISNSVEQRSARTSEVVLMDVVPLSIGVEVDNGKFDVIIRRNTTIPYRATKAYSTVYDNQTEVEVQVFEGERPLTRHNHRLGSFVLDGITRARRGDPTVMVTFSVDADGILTITATEELAKVTRTLVVESAERLSDAEVQKMIDETRQLSSKNTLAVCVKDATERLSRAFALLDAALAATPQPFSPKLQKCVSFLQHGKEWVERRLPNSTDVKALEAKASKILRLVQKAMKTLKHEARSGAVGDGGKNAESDDGEKEDDDDDDDDDNDNGGDEKEHERVEGMQLSGNSAGRKRARKEEG